MTALAVQAERDRERRAELGLELVEQQPAPTGRCHYCGGRAQADTTACAGHRDLVELDTQETRR